MTEASQHPRADASSSPSSEGLWSPARRQLTVGLLLTITLVAFESLAVATVMPEVKDDLGGLALYGWVFSGFFLASLLGIVVSGRLADERGLGVPFTAGLVLFCVGLVVGGAGASVAGPGDHVLRSLRCDLTGGAGRVAVLCGRPGHHR